MAVAGCQAALPAGAEPLMKLTLIKGLCATAQKELFLTSLYNSALPAGEVFF